MFEETKITCRGKEFHMEMKGSVRIKKWTTMQVRARSLEDQSVNGFIIQALQYSNEGERLIRQLYHDGIVILNALYY